MSGGRRSDGFRKSSSGQAPVLAGIFFLLLVPTTVILAQNATLNITGELLANLTPGNGTAPLNATPADPFHDNATENTTTLLYSNTSLPNATSGTENHNASISQTNATLPNDASHAVNQTSPQGNQTSAPGGNQTISPENETNTTMPDGKFTYPAHNENAPEGNATSRGGNQTNTTIPGNATNQTAGNETLSNETAHNQSLQNDTKNITGNQTNLTGPGLNLSLSLPERADRGHPFNVTALVENTGGLPAEDATLEWILPKGFAVLQGSRNQSFDLGPGASFRSRLLLETPLGVGLGMHEIMARVVYHD